MRAGSVFLVAAALLLSGPAAQAASESNTVTNNNRPVSTVQIPDGTAPAAQPTLDQVAMMAMSQQSKIKKKSLLSKMDDGVKAAAAAVVGDTVGAVAGTGSAVLGFGDYLMNPNREDQYFMPPTTTEDPNWPFTNRHQKEAFEIFWADGSAGKIMRYPDGTYTIISRGHMAKLEPTTGGAYMLTGDDGSMGTVSPRPAGGFNIITTDGQASVVLPKQTGGFDIYNDKGEVAVIMPGPGGGKHHVFARRADSLSAMGSW